MVCDVNTIYDRDSAPFFTETKNNDNKNDSENGNKIDDVSQ